MAPAEDITNATAVKNISDTSIAIPQRSPAPEAGGRRFRLLDGLLALVVVLFAFLTALFPAYNSDFLLHAATGRLIANGQYQIGVDPFAFTTQGAVWINHSWLYDWIVFLIFNSSAAGGAILIVLKALMVAALAYVMLRTAGEPGRSWWIPAACIGLAVLTLSPRVLLQPVVVSFLFLGLTLWLLYLPRKLGGLSRRRFLPYWLIPPLCLIWVNCDEWFVLGPATVALYLIGQTLQDWFGPQNIGTDAPAPGERLNLLLVLIASVVLCLVNPHHIGALVLPSQLGLGAATEVLHKDSQFRAHFISPTEGIYFYLTTGLSAAGMAYFPLALLGVVSFAAAQWIGRWRWERVLLWTAFFALSLWHARAIAFFAVVAGPIASLNFLDFAAERFGVKAQRGAWPLGGRILTLLAGLVLLVLTWPGWLQALPWELRRAGWEVVPNPALKQMAEQITTWQDNHLIKPDAHWFNTAPDVLSYLAWYCPGQRAFIDNQRLSLYNEATTQDFETLSKSLAREEGDAASADPKWRRVLRAHDVSLLLWYDGRPFPLLPRSPLPTLLAAPKEWPLLYVNGRAAAFGWRAPSHEETAAPDPFAALEFDSKKAAFGPDAVTAPAEAPPASQRAWWSAYWTPDAPRPPDADAAALQWLRFELLTPLWRERNEKKWDALWDQQKRLWQIGAIADCLGGGNLPGNLLEVDAVQRFLKRIPEHTPMPSIPPRPGEEFQASLARQMFDLGPPDALYLGVRAARRALAVKTDDAPTYQYLAQNYSTLVEQTRENIRAAAVGYPLLLRRVQLATALHNALEYDPDLEAAHLLSEQFYQETGFLDLAKEHAEKRLAILLQSPDERIRRQAETLSKQVSNLSKEVAERQTSYQLHAAGQPPLGKVKVALGLGLGQTALDILEKIDWQTIADADPNKPAGAQKELSLFLQTGRAEEVSKVLIEKEQALSNNLGVDPETGLPAYEWLRVQAAAALGDYTEADRWLQAIQEKMRQTPRTTAALQQLGSIILGEAPAASEMTWLSNTLSSTTTRVAATGVVIAEPLERQSDLEVVRGWLALESGRVAEAREHFHEALRYASPGNLPFHGRGLMDLDLEWMDSAK